MSARIECDPNPEYVYVTIPAEYVCVYHKILVMLADYGEDMLKDCKASCTDRNMDIIECYNMFNAAVAARAIGQGKKATLIINYIKAKINNIYKNADNNPGYVFPIDEKGQIKAFVSCNDRPRFWINSEDGVLYKKNMELGYKEHYELDKKDKPWSNAIRIPEIPEPNDPFDVFIEASSTDKGNLVLKLTFYLNGEKIEDTSNISYDLYFDRTYVRNAYDVKNMDYGRHLITLICEYKDDDNNYLIHKYATVKRELK